jgi:hypothetical protein
MDHRSILTVSEFESRHDVTIDQAIFTSVPSLTGEGYRIVASSPGLKPNEKVEITRHCPSHSGLNQAVGLSSYGLSAGRHCVGYSCYAGTEHTARGGQRVYTHLVVLDRETFRKFDFNPLPIHRALGNIVGETPDLKPANRLNSISLQLPKDTGAVREITIPVEHVCAVASVLLNRDRLIAVGSVDPFGLLDWVLQVLAFPTRESLSVSIGLNFTPARKTQLTFLDEGDAQTQRLIRGQDIHWLNLSATADLPASPYVRWLDHFRRWWRQGQFDKIRKLASHLNFEGSPEELERILTLCEDFKHLDSADPLVLDNLRIKYTQLQPANDAEHYLTLELLRQLNQQIATLEKEPAAVE